MNTINEYGWSEIFDRDFEKKKKTGDIPARIINRQKGSYTVISSEGVKRATLSGKFTYKNKKESQFPVVGDWVAIRSIGNRDQAIISQLLTRKNIFARKMKIIGGRRMKKGLIQGGTTDLDILAANIDTVFLVAGLDDNYHIGRIERYLTLVYENDLNAVVILNKCDLCRDMEHVKEEISSVAQGVPVHFISATENLYMDSFDSYMQPGQTMVFLGSSGVGKSTIINALFGNEMQKTKEVSDFSGKGKHTTTTSDMIIHESGSMMIDTPGMRELQLWADHASVDKTFDDIKQLASNCRFNDCKHMTEPGCEVRKAVEDGRITEKRLEGYIKQHSEVSLLEMRRKQLEHMQNSRQR